MKQVMYHIGVCAILTKNISIFSGILTIYTDCLMLLRSDMNAFNLQLKVHKEYLLDFVLNYFHWRNG